MAAGGGHVFLVNGVSALPSSSCSTSPSIIDKLAYGTGNCPEGTAAPAPSANGSLVRKPGGTDGSGHDTDVNSADFQAGVLSTPHNGLSAPATPPSALGNVRSTLFLTPGASGTSLEWGRAAGATAYRVYRGTEPGFLDGAPAPWMVVVEPRLIVQRPADPLLRRRATDGVAESSELIVSGLQSRRFG
jgi:hypothetical protein